VFAVLLFAAGFGIVSIGQKAFAALQHSRILDRLEIPAHIKPKPIEEEPQPDRIAGPESLADYAARASRAFAAMDASCSAAERRALGQAFHDLMEATTALHAGRIEAGSPSPASAHKIASAKTDLIPASTASPSDPVIFAQVIDASRRGILTSDDFPAGMARLMHIQMMMIQGNDSRPAAVGNTGQPGGQAMFKRTRCQPI
jgi:hypothetical protein